MPYKHIEDRRKNYQENKDRINKKRREKAKIPEIKEKLRKEFKKWRNNNLEKAKRISRESKKRYEDKCKNLVFEHYGNKCANCGIDDMDVLTIDHIKGGGTKHRKKIKGEKITVWLKKNNFPKGFQTLCFNCNWKKHKNK